MRSAAGQQVWETFIRSPEELQQRAEVSLIIRDLTPGRRKYQLRHVVALVSRQPPVPSQGATLWVRTTVGVQLDQPWTIKILRELPIELPGQPYRNVYDALKKAAKMGF